MENPTSTLRVPGRTQETAINATPLALEEVVNDVVHRVTNEAVTKYKKLIEDPLLQETWSKAMCKALEKQKKRTQ